MAEVIRMDGLPLSGRSFERRHRLAMRRTNTSRFDLESDSAIVERVAKGASEDRPVVFAVFRHTSGEGPGRAIELTAFVGRCARKVDPASVVRLLADGAVLCVMGPFDSRHEGHDVVDALFAFASADSGSEFEEVVGGFALTTTELDAKHALERAVVASHHADSDAPFKAFTPFMSVQPGVEVCIDLTPPGDSTGLIAERLVDTRFERTFGVVVTASEAEDSAGLALSVDAATDVVQRSIADFASFDSWSSPPAIWLDMTTAGLDKSEQRSALATALAASERTVGLIFAEADIAGLDPVPMAAFNELGRSGVPLALREFSGRHVGLTRLPELGISQIIFEPAFIEDAVTGSTRSLVSDIVASLESIGIHAVVRGVQDEVEPIQAATGVHRVRVQTSGEQLMLPPLPADRA